MAAAAHGEGDAVGADLSFHRAVLLATHNELLLRTEIVLEPGLAARDHVVHAAVDDDDPTPAHAAVLDAIRAGDPERAVKRCERAARQVPARPRPHQRRNHRHRPSRRSK